MCKVFLNLKAIMDTKFVCLECVNNTYLQNEMKRSDVKVCHYCKQQQPCMTIEALADYVYTALKNHFMITSTEPEPWVSAMMNDKEYNGDGWYRDGMDLSETIESLLECDEELNDDIIATLSSRLYEISGFDEYDEDPLFEATVNKSIEWERKLYDLEHSIKSESRFFNRKVEETLDDIFDGLEHLTTRKGDSVLICAGPESKQIHSLFRARVHSSSESLQQTLSSPEKELGPPPANIASAGRMNARGISVFYGALDQHTAISEVRPHVGSYVVVGKFDLVKPLTLINLSALQEIVKSRAELLDPNTYRLEQQAIFLEQLSKKISKPIHPHEIELEYITTQVIAEYLGQKVDGLVFKSAQHLDENFNVVLFHSSSLVEQNNPKFHQDISVHFFDYWDPEKMSPRVTIWEERFKGNIVQHLHTDTFGKGFPSLKLDRDNIFVSEIQGITYKSSSEKVSFNTYEKKEFDEF